MFCIRAKCLYKEYTKKTVSKIEFSNKILFLKATKYSFKNLFSKTKFFEMFEIVKQNWRFNFSKLHRYKYCLLFFT